MVGYAEQPHLGYIHCSKSNPTKVELYFQNNTVSDLSPLVTNSGLGTNTEIDVRGNPLSYPSIYAYIPTLQARGAYVDFGNRVAAAPLKISGATQQGAPSTTLTNPFVVEVQDANGAAFAGVPGDVCPSPRAAAR